MMWTDDPERDAERYQEYLEGLNDAGCPRHLSEDDWCEEMEIDYDYAL